MLGRGRHVGWLLISFIAGCSDPSPEAGPTSSNPASSPAPVATNAPALPRPLTSSELQRYGVELGKLMPEKRVIRRVRGPSPAGGDVVEVEGFDQVILARRAPDGRAEQACVGTVEGAMEFMAGSHRGGETE